MRIALAFLGITLLLATACGHRPATLGTESAAETRQCQEALAVQDEVLERIDPANAALRDKVIAVADLGSCEDGDPTSGVALDVADLRQRLTVVVDRESAQIRGQRPATGGKDVSKSEKTKD